MSDMPLLRLQDVAKEYPLAASGSGRLANLWSLLRTGRVRSAYAALSGITLDVYAGQSLGLIGENGAGKSTLLKIAAGVVRPTVGVVEKQGRLGALLELGAGFHPEYTGRENVVLAAGLMGMDRAQTQARLPDILAFAAIGDQIDQPIKHYSSGMVVRLGFAVATALKPDILITDEVLAVGDESFQKKCIAWIENYLAGGGTLLLCSHNMFHIQKLCKKTAWIDKGRLRRFGDSADVVRDYLAWHEENRPTAGAGPMPGAQPSADCCRLVSFAINGRDQEGVVSQPMDSDLVVSGSVYSPDGRIPNVAVGIVRADGTGIYGIVSDMDGVQLIADGDRRFRFRLTYPALQLLPGRYQIRGHAMDPEGLRMFDHVERTLDITGNTRELGLCRLPHRWTD